jgi:hypothetical protein
LPTGSAAASAGCEARSAEQPADDHPLHALGWALSLSICEFWIIVHLIVCQCLPEGGQIWVLLTDSSSKKIGFSAGSCLSKQYMKPVTSAPLFIANEVVVLVHCCPNETLSGQCVVSNDISGLPTLTYVCHSPMQIRAKNEHRRRYLGFTLERPKQCRIHQQFSLTT